MQETWLRFLGWEDPLEKEMTSHSSILAWRISWTEKPGGVQSMGSQGSDTTERLSTCTHLLPPAPLPPRLAYNTEQSSLLHGSLIPFSGCDFNRTDFDGFGRREHKTLCWLTSQSRKWWDFLLSQGWAYCVRIQDILPSPRHCCTEPVRRLLFREEKPQQPCQIFALGLDGRLFLSAHVLVPDFALSAQRLHPTEVWGHPLSISRAGLRNISR